MNQTRRSVLGALTTNTSHEVNAKGYYDDILALFLVEI